MNTLLVTGNRGGGLFIGTPAGALISRAEPTFSTPIYSVCPFINHGQLYVCYTDGLGCVWVRNPDGLRYQQHNRGQRAVLTTYTVHGQRWLASVTQTGVLETWELMDTPEFGRTDGMWFKHDFGSPTQGLSSITVGREAWLALATKAGLQLISPRSGEVVTPAGQSGSFTSICVLGHHNQMLATANLTGITLWDHTFNPVARLSSRFRHGATTRRPQVRYLEMEGKGLLVLAQSDHTIEILDVQSGRLISTLPCHHAINDFGVFYTTKGHPRLAIGEAGGEISIWDPSVDAPISTFAWGTEEITTLRAIRV